jgi:hypothetical protein
VICERKHKKKNEKESELMWEKKGGGGKRWMHKSKFELNSGCNPNGM